MKDSLPASAGPLLAVERGEPDNTPAKIDELNQLAWSLRLSDLQRGLAVSQQAYELARTLPAYQPGLCRSLRSLGYYHERLGHADLALAYLQQARALAEAIGSPEELAQVHQLLSQVYERQGDWKLALQHYKQFHSLKEQIFTGPAQENLPAGPEQAEIHQLKNAEPARRENTHHRTAQLEALREVGLALTSELDLDALLHTITAQAIELLGAAAGWLYLYRPEQDVLASVVTIDPSGRIPSAVLRRGEGLTGKVLETGQPLIVDDYEHWPGQAAIFKGYNVSAVMGVPIWLGQEFLGVLSIVDRPTPFGAADVELLSLFATQAAVAIRNAQLVRSLQESEARYRAIVEDQIELICRFKPNGVITFVNEAVCRQHGRPREALLGQNIFPLMPQLSRDKVMRFVATCDPQNPISFEEQQVISPTGETRWLQWIDRAIFDEQGQVLEIQSVGRDTTALKAAQEALQRSEQRYRVISDLTSDYAYAFRLEADGKLALDWITDAFSRMTGFDPHEISTLQDWGNLLHPDDAPGVYQRLQQTLLTGQLDVSEFRVVTRHGDVRWLRNYVRPIWDNANDQVVSLYGAAQDITERKQTEEALRESEQRYKELAEERSVLYAETRKRLNYQTALSKAAAAISSSLDLATVLHHIAEQLGHAIDATSTYLSLYHEETGLDQVVAEYFSPMAGPAERVSHLGATYDLPNDLPGLYAFLQSDQPALTRHHDDPDLAEPDRAHLARYGAWSTLTIRLELAGKIIGEASIWESRWRRVFTAAEIALCQSIAQHAVIAIENARLYSEAQQRLKEQTALLEATTMISSTLDLPTVLNRMVEQMGQVVDATSAYICSYEPATSCGAVLAEYISAQACPGERISDLGVVYNLPQDLPGAWAFLQSDQSARIHHVDDLQIPASERAHMQEFGAQTTLLIRLGIGDETIGYAALWESRQRRIFTTAEIALCQSIAQQAAIAIQHARLYAETQQRLKEQMALREAITVISSTLDLPVVLKRIVEQMCRAIDVTSVYLYDYDAQEMTITVIAEHYSPQADALAQTSDIGVVYYLPQDLPGVYTFLQSNQVAQVQSLPRAAGWTHSRQVGGFTSLMVRLQVGGETIGYADLWESRYDRQFSADEIVLCQGIAQQAAIAIKNARLLEQTRQDAETKAMLLQEANHRVKNNLSTIIGLLYAERRHTDIAENAVFQTIMQGLINRVQGLATAHSMLSATEWGPLSLCELTKQVIGSTLQALPSGKAVFVEVLPSPVRVAPQQANHLALVINELTVNTLKYALAEQATIRIMVRIAYTEEGVLFEFQNDGPGYPAEVLNSTRHNTGLYLVHSIVRKGLRGEVELYNNPGATVLIRFPGVVE